MGQHKTNPTAIAAKNGKFAPKTRGPGKREVERKMQTKLYEYMAKHIWRGFRNHVDKEIKNAYD